jgi:hypothetical protein
MRLPSIWAKLFRSPPGPAAIPAEPTDTQKVVAILLGLPIATDTQDRILSLENDSLSDPQKFEIVVGHAILDLIALAAGRGLEAAPHDVEDIAREFVQAVYNVTASPRAPAMAHALLKLLGAR